MFARVWILLAAILIAASLLAIARGFVAIGVAGFWLTCLPATLAVLSFELMPGGSSQRRG